MSSTGDLNADAPRRQAACDAGATRRRRASGWLLPAAAAIAVIATLTLSSPALALSGQGHVFGSAFNVQGEPLQVAVDEATGEVYVVDAKGERVERYHPGAGGYELAGTFRVDSPGAVAVDNSGSSSDPSAGDVYVVGSEEAGAEPGERDYLYKFTASGEKIYKHDLFKGKTGKEPQEELELEDISGIGVDAQGNVWLYWGEEGRIDALDDAAANKLQPAQALDAEVEAKLGQCPARPGFAVARHDEAFYIGYERYDAAEECPGEEGLAGTVRVAKLNSAGELVTREIDRQDMSGVALDSSDAEAYVDNDSSVSAFTAEGGLIDTFGATGETGALAGASGVAVDASDGQVFAAEPALARVEVFDRDERAGAPVIDAVSSKDITPSSSELAAEIDPNGAAAKYSFRYCRQDTPASCATVGAGELPAGFGDRAVSVVVQGLSPATAYEYLVLASNADGSTEGVPSSNTFTTLPSASVLPDDRAWELVTPPDKHGASVELPRENRAGLIQAAADGDAIAWLASGAVIGEPQGSRSFQPTQLVSVRTGEGWQTESLETPHNRGGGLHNPSPTEYDYFSSNLALSLLAPPEPGQSTEDPPLSAQATEKTLYVRADPPLTPEPSEQALYQTVQQDSGYLPPGYLPLVTAGNDPAGSSFGGRLEFLNATPDLQHVIFDSAVALGNTPAAPGLYEWTPGKPLQLVSVLPDGTAAREPWLGDGEGDEQRVGLNARNAISRDGSTVYFTEGNEHLYLHDSESGQTILVNAAQGHEATQSGPGGNEVPEPEAEQQQVHFQTASTDGHDVFFTDTARLTEDSQLQPVHEEGPADLYEFELTSGSGQLLGGRLVDLTAGGVQDAADVLGLLPGAGEDGSDVYFVANGVLAPGAVQGDCPRYPEEAVEAGATCNLYVSEPDPQAPAGRQTRFIAALSAQDGADWGQGPSSRVSMHENLASVTSRVSPNGRYLAFMSDRSLTGYDNTDAASGQPDEEVYLYDAQTGRLVCASCNPNQGAGGGWQRPRGVFDTEGAGEGLGLLADSPEIWRERWLAGSIPGWTFNISATSTRPYAVQQSRYLSNEGRLFFDSPDDLVPAASNGKEDVYEYEPEGMGTCQASSGCIGLISSGTSNQESVFLDASENGDDVFFMTAAKLVAADEDEAFDIYDARVCSEASPCLSSPAANPRPCESTATCRSAPAPEAPGAVPATASAATSAGATSSPGSHGQVSPGKTTAKAKRLTRAQQLILALKRCRKQHPHSKRERKTCEANATKRYTPRGKGSKARAKKTTTRRGGRR
jgi:DNA-binding beta-propeller fold protein YncE